MPVTTHPRRMPTMHTSSTGRFGETLLDQLVYDPVNDPYERARRITGEGHSPASSYSAPIARYMGPGEDTYVTASGEQIGSFTGPPDRGGYRDTVQVDAPMEVGRNQHEGLMQMLMQLMRSKAAR